MTDLTDIVHRLNEGEVITFPADRINDDDIQDLIKQVSSWTIIEINDKMTIRKSDGTR